MKYIKIKNKENEIYKKIKTKKIKNDKS